MRSVVESVYGRRAEVVPPGVDAEVFKLNRGRRAARAVSVGALDPTKGHDIAVCALALLPEEGRPALDIVYERALDGYQEHLATLGRDLGVLVAFHRGVPDPVLAGLYGGASVTICAARLEPFGLTPLESLAVGTPVVAVDEGGFRETVEPGISGLLVGRDPGSIAEGIESVLRVPPGNPDAIRARALRWSWDATAAGIVEALEAASAPPGARVGETVP